jgi:hypothetical protein
MHSGRYQRLAEKSMEQSQCKHWLKGWRQIGGKAFSPAKRQQATCHIGPQVRAALASDDRVTAALSSRMPGSRGGSLYHTHPFSFLRSCRSLPPSFDWKGSRKTQTRKEWRFEKLDSFSSIQPICKSTDFPVRDLIFLSTDNEDPAPVSAHENRRGPRRACRQSIYFPDSVSKRTRSSFHNAAMVWLP